MGTTSSRRVGIMKEEDLKSKIEKLDKKHFYMSNNNDEYTFIINSLKKKENKHYIKNFLERIENIDGNTLECFCLSFIPNDLIFHKTSNESFTEFMNASFNLNYNRVYLSYLIMRSLYNGGDPILDLCDIAFLNKHLIIECKYGNIETNILGYAISNMYRRKNKEENKTFIDKLKTEFKKRKLDLNKYIEFTGDNFETEIKKDNNDRGKKRKSKSKSKHKSKSKSKSKSKL